MLSVVRDVLNVDIAFLCGGNIRGDKVYTGVHVSMHRYKTTAAVVR